MYDLLKEDGEHSLVFMVRKVAALPSRCSPRRSYRGVLHSRDQRSRRRAVESACGDTTPFESCIHRTNKTFVTGKWQARPKYRCLPNYRQGSPVENNGR